MENDTPNKIKISKEIIATLPIETFPGKIVVIDNERDADNAVLQLNNESIIGFDTETRPTFKKGKSNHVALIQLSTHDTCYLFRINRIGFTPAIKNLLENESLLKVGISLKDDFCMLNRLNSGQFIPRNFIELQKFVKKYNIEDQSLQKIYGIVIGKKISKATIIQLGRRSSYRKSTTLCSDRCLELHKNIRSFEIWKIQISHIRNKIQPSSL